VAVRSPAELPPQQIIKPMKKKWRVSVLAIMALTVMATVAVAPKLTRRSRLVMAIAPVKPHALTREEMLQNARNWLGVPYRLGGKNREGVDCSAFVSVLVWQNSYYNPSCYLRRQSLKNAAFPGSA